MAASVNKVILIGNLGADPELKQLPSGQAVCELRIATTDIWTDRNSQRQERTEWHRVKVWGKTAENCKQYLAKGRQVYVEGRLQTDSWDDKETGQKRYATNVIAQSVQFLGSGGERGERPAAGAGSATGASRGETRPQRPSTPEAAPDFGGPGPSDDDIPF
jgi:single-strand DNA-binding protein